MKKLILFAITATVTVACFGQEKHDFDRNKYPIQFVVLDTVFRLPRAVENEMSSEDLFQYLRNLENESIDALYKAYPIMGKSAFVGLYGGSIWEKDIPLSEVKKQVLERYKNPNTGFINFAMYEGSSDYRKTLDKVYIVLTPECQDGSCGWFSEYRLPTWLFPEVFKWCNVCNK
jgi:hypothetical protein